MGLDWASGDNFAHRGVALASLVPPLPLALLVSPWLIVLSVPIALGFGFWREHRQHRAKVPKWTKHRVMEALSWGEGALVWSGIYLAVALTR